VGRIERSFSARYEKLDAKFYRLTKQCRALAILTFVTWVSLCFAVIFIYLSRSSHSSDQIEVVYEQVVLNLQTGTFFGVFSLVGYALLILAILIALVVIVLTLGWITIYVYSRASITVEGLRENARARKAMSRNASTVATLSTVAMIAISTFQAGFVFEGEGWEALAVTIVITLALTSACRLIQRNTKLGWGWGVGVWLATFAMMGCFIYFQPNFDAVRYFSDISWNGRIFLIISVLSAFIAPALALMFRKKYGQNQSKQIASDK